MEKFQAFRTQKDWQDPTVTGINRTLAHVAFGAYENKKQALTCDRTASKWTCSLNGQWSFRFYQSPDAVEEGFYLPSFDHSGWDKIAVPSCWELTYGDPIYTNTDFPWSLKEPKSGVIYPFDAEREEGFPNAPFVPDMNPTGCYFTTFDLAADWAERETLVLFEGVETAFYLWVNGKPVGYSEDSKLPCEFDLTSFVKAGENTIALQVLRFGSSMYMEDQDYWFLSGITRNVSLYSKPAFHIKDWKLAAIPDLHTKDGNFTIDVKIPRLDGYADYSVAVSLYDMQDKLLAEGTSKVNAYDPYWKLPVPEPTANTARVRLTASNISFWSPESPVLYKAVIVLLDKNGKEVDFESCRFGFKKVAIENGILYLNGQRMLIRGTNRHEHEAYGGRTVTPEHMLAEIKQMKRLNINAVRTSHYPNSPVWYDLCDEYGILVLCECNLETHGISGELTQNPLWATSFLERAMRMVMTHKNHACIYGWSLGNESGSGPNHAAMYGFIKEYDDTCICQYEGANPEKNISDIRGAMYAPQIDIMKMLTNPTDDRPVILVEYLYQIRNAGGGMHKFYTLLENFARFQGAFVWDWQDKALVNKTADGADYFAYGGDFNESVLDRHHPYFMTNNGIVLPDLTPKPAALEMKQIYCPIVIEEERPQYYTSSDAAFPKLVLKNRSMFTGTEAYKAVMTVSENGKVIKTSDFPLPALAPGKDVPLTIAEDFDRKAGCEYTMEFYISLAQDTFYADAGYEVGKYQFDFGCTAFVPAAAQAPVTGALSIEESGASITVKSADVLVAWDKATGLISAYEKKGVSYLSGGQECFARPFSGADVWHTWGPHNALWKVYHKMNAAVVSVDVQPLGTSSAVVTVLKNLTFEGNPYGIRTKSVFTADADGKIVVGSSVSMDKGLMHCPRVGLELVVAPGFENFTYYGYGPLENYRDRKNASLLGVYDSSVEAEHFAFIPPSENGGHEGCRYITLKNAAGNALTITSGTAFHFDIHHNSIADYNETGHEHELIRRPESYLHIDALHAGIGGDMGWSTTLIDEHKIFAGEYHFSVTIEAK